MKEYVHGLFTTEVEINWTSDCTQLYFVESIRKISCLQTELAAIVMEDFIPFWQTAVHGLRSVSGLYHDQEMLR